KKAYIRTDLAIEAKDMYVKDEQEESSIKGIQTKEKVESGVKVVHVTIDEKAEKSVGKKAGTYITLHTESVKEQDATNQIEAATILSKELKRLLRTNGVKNDAVGLIVGLGNYNVTPDALG